MKIEIINKPMLCWDDNESEAIEYHVLAKVTECDSEYPYKAICNENRALSIIGESRSRIVDRVLALLIKLR